jgi:hypothetical protein
MTENKSEVAQLRARIAAEYEAAQRALYGPAVVGRHDFITARTENISKLVTELTSHVGIEAAAQIFAEVLEKAPDAPI